MPLPGGAFGMRIYPPAEKGFHTTGDWRQGQGSGETGLRLPNAKLAFCERHGQGPAVSVARGMVLEFSPPFVRPMQRERALF